MARDVSLPFLLSDHDLSTTPVLVGEDNPAFEGVFEFCTISAGGSIGMYEFLPPFISIFHFWRP